MSTLMPSFCRHILDVGNFLNYVSASSVSCMLCLSWYSDKAYILNPGSTYRGVTQGMPRVLRSALCSSSQRLKPTRGVLLCYTTSWRYANWLRAAIIQISSPLIMTCLITSCVACVAKEAEANHPELLALPDDIELCDKAAGYWRTF